MISKIKNRLLDFRGILSVDLARIKPKNIQKSREFLYWCHYSLVDYAKEFFQERKLGDSLFVRIMNSVFKGGRFTLFIKKWTVEYLFDLFCILYDYANTDSCAISLEDNPLNRFASEKFYSRFKIIPQIHWFRRAGIFRGIACSSLMSTAVLYSSLKKGVKWSGAKRSYMIMREALWGLSYGYFFHDDFLVNGKLIGKRDLLLFTRSTSNNFLGTRVRAFNDARNSDYSHFTLTELKIGTKPLFTRVIKKYAIQGTGALLSVLGSADFSFFQNIFYCFLQSALPYEKIFSNFNIKAELGHLYSASGHIPESIVCQNYGARYYLMHWSDNSLNLNKFINSFLACDKNLIWGKAHIRGVEGPSSVFASTGYLFKRSVIAASSDKERILEAMKIKPQGKLISFFDECFGNFNLMTENHYLEFWRTILKLARSEPEHTVIVKPKDLNLQNALSPILKEEFIRVKEALEQMPNAHIIDYNKWSFIESIGISDIVVTQGMTSSSTIALICGIEGLYLDEAHYDHPFSRLYKDELVFYESQKLIEKIKLIISGKDSALRKIPDELLREYDQYPDDRGIDILREILSGNEFRQFK